VIAHVLYLVEKRLDELVKGPGVDHEPRLKSMPWALTLSSLAWAEVISSDHPSGIPNLEIIRPGHHSTQYLQRSALSPQSLSSLLIS
jgi:hypothetical protein